MCINIINQQPSSQGALEHFHQTLKPVWMLLAESGLLLAAREVVHESTGFHPRRSWCLGKRCTVHCGPSLRYSNSQIWPISFWIPGCRKLTELCHANRGWARSPKGEAAEESESVHDDGLLQGSFEKLSENSSINGSDVGKHAELVKPFNKFPSLFSDSAWFRFNRSSTTEMLGMLSLSDTVFF